MNALIIDTECTGIENPEVIEAAWIRLSCPVHLRVEGTFSQRYKPTKRITLGALATHGIKDEVLADCEPSSSFKLPEGVEYIIGHNVDFDWQAIGKPDVKRICLLALCRLLWPEADSHGQSAMIWLLERDSAKSRLDGAHSAVVDTTNCLCILSHILNRIDCHDWHRLHEASEDARIPRVMTFGKHKGQKIEDVPKDYKAWLLRQPDVDPYLAKALQK